MHIFHKWVAVAAKNRLEPFREPLTLEIRKDVAAAKTDVLYCCDCGRIKTVTILGTWTLSDVQNKREG